MPYKVFVRNWWREERDSHGNKKLVPHPGARKSNIGIVDTREEAQAFCKKWNSENDPGKLSRKAEFQQR